MVNLLEFWSTLRLDERGSWLLRSCNLQGLYKDLFGEPQKKKNWAVVLAYSWDLLGLVITMPGWKKNEIIACNGTDLNNIPVQHMHLSWQMQLLLWDAHTMSVLKSCHAPTGPRPWRLESSTGPSKDLAICTERDSEIAPAWQLTETLTGPDTVRKTP